MVGQLMLLRIFLRTWNFKGETMKTCQTCGNILTVEELTDGETKCLRCRSDDPFAKYETMPQSEGDEFQSH